MAKWILGWTPVGGNVLVNMDTVACISQGQIPTEAVLEWSDGNLQITLQKPTFDQLYMILDK